MRNADDLRELFANCDDAQRELVQDLIDEVAFIENQLEELRKLPFIQVNPRNPLIQRQTEASKQYKSLMQVYNNCVKTLAVVANRGANAEEHPFMAWIREQRGE